jgi:thiol-disulfide isomerase/thioredoxin
MTRFLIAAILLLAAAVPARADHLEGALARARREDRALVVEFRASWCGPCKLFEKHVLASPRVKAELHHRLFVSLDVDDVDDAEVAKQYRVTVIPTFLSLDPSGEVLQRSTGIMDVLSPQAFIAFFERAETWREYRRRQSDPRIARYVEDQIDAVRRAPGASSAGWALAHAAIAGLLLGAERSTLFDLHARNTRSMHELAFTIYAALAAGSPEDAAEVADLLVARTPTDGAALAAAAYAYLEVNRSREAFELWRECDDIARAVRERRACRTLVLRMMLGRPHGVIELIRHAVRLRVLAALGSGGQGADAAERAAYDAVWGEYPEQDVTESADGNIPDRAGTLWLHSGLVDGLIAFRTDRGLSGEGRFQLGGRGLLALRPGYDVKPMGLVTAEVGMDFSDEIAYEGSLQIGFAVAGGVLGIYSGISASDPGAGAGGAVGVPLELALSYPVERFGVEAFIRSTVIVAGDEPRADGSENAPFAADELSFGAAARIPDTSIMVGVRHDQLLDTTLTALWLGVQLAP